MDRIYKWIAMIAAIATIFTFIITVIGPFRNLLIFGKHIMGEWTSDSNFRIQTIRDKNGRVLNPGDRFSYLFHLPIRVSGTTQFANTTRIWVILRDEYGGYYVQNPPVNIETGKWRATNIRPRHRIADILFIRVDQDGDTFFRGKVSRREWGKFLELPVGYECVGSIKLE